MYGQWFAQNVPSAQEVHYLAITNTVTWLDPIINFFYDWKKGIALLTLMGLCSVGVYRVMAGKIPTGIFLIILGVVLAAAFYRIETWIHIADNSQTKYQKPANNDPFKRGAMREMPGLPPVIVLERLS
ncbi:Uncharacterised protein [Mycobacteroides abscessus subsp. massiliense]|uniref:hypothetical protein n=1 Tax=Mycobacteroides abscessus TaxID=36809 RepID=UPI0009A7DF69|nr:hypothetical protein [Mycobacteroides abscessus]SLE83260.1 Uncharacterised protein [Mycobacteroides abscessus subsp. massiliense]